MADCVSLMLVIHLCWKTEARNLSFSLNFFIPSSFSGVHASGQDLKAFPWWFWGRLMNECILRSQSGLCTESLWPWPFSKEQLTTRKVDIYRKFMFRNNRYSVLFTGMKRILKSACGFRNKQKNRFWKCSFLMVDKVVQEILRVVCFVDWEL